MRALCLRCSKFDRGPRPGTMGERARQLDFPLSGGWPGGAAGERGPCAGFRPGLWPVEGCRGDGEAAAWRTGGAVLAPGGALPRRGRGLRAGGSKPSGEAAGRAGPRGRFCAAPRGPGRRGRPPGTPPAPGRSRPPGAFRGRPGRPPAAAIRTHPAIGRRRRSLRRAPAELASGLRSAPAGPGSGRPGSAPAVPRPVLSRHHCRQWAHRGSSQLPGAVSGPGVRSHLRGGRGPGGSGRAAQPDPGLAFIRTARPDGVAASSSPGGMRARPGAR
jgi:translation initiation factor IF-2